MADQTQVYCIEDPPPTIQQLMQLFSEEAFDVRMTDGGGEEDADPEDPTWMELRLHLEDGEAFQLECWHDEESDEFSEQRDELLELIDDLEDAEKAKIVRHLKKSTFLINIIEVEDPTEEAQTLLGALVAYLESNHNGLTFVEDEGFYFNEEIIMEV